MYQLVSRVQDGLGKLKTLLENHIHQQGLGAIEKCGESALNVSLSPQGIIDTERQIDNLRSHGIRIVAAMPLPKTNNAPADKWGKQDDNSSMHVLWDPMLLVNHIESDYHPIAARGGSLRISLAFRWASLCSRAPDMDSAVFRTQNSMYRLYWTSTRNTTYSSSQPSGAMLALWQLWIRSVLPASAARERCRSLLAWRPPVKRREHQHKPVYLPYLIGRWQIIWIIIIFIFGVHIAGHTINR